MPWRHQVYSGRCEQGGNNTRYNARIDTYTNKAATIQDTGVLDFAPLTAMGQWRSDTIHKYVVYYMLYTRVHGIDTSWQFDWRRPRLFVPFDQRSSETVRDDFYRGRGSKGEGTCARHCTIIHKLEATEKAVDYGTLPYNLSSVPCWHAKRPKGARGAGGACRRCERRLGPGVGSRKSEGISAVRLVICVRQLPDPPRIFMNPRCKNLVSSLHASRPSARVT